MVDCALVSEEVTESLQDALTTARKEVRQRFWPFWNHISALMRKKCQQQQQQRWADMTDASIKNMTNAFLSFMVDLLGSYREFIQSEMITKNKTDKQQQTKLKDEPTFDRRKFIRHSSVHFRSFLQVVLQSQMFEVFLLITVVFLLL